MGDRPSHLLRLWRLRCGRNLLARRCDRVDGRLLLVALLLTLIVAPFAAAVASEITARGIERSRQETSTRYPATAVTLADAFSREAGDIRGTTAHTKVDVAATWTARDGTQRVGIIPVAEGTADGTATAIWLDAAGNPTIVPLRIADAIASGAMVGVLIWLAIGATLTGTWWLVHLVFNRYRYVQWARERERIGRDSSYS
ncbi:hypothetical protein [Amycolatopsis sp. NPDC051903]|uniref:Rv1733c family protein n=1 Tax=Amycolatopsis sp. NPDC051903 TaxID=3363936 RepID=UPI003787D4C5